MLERRMRKRRRKRRRSGTGEEKKQQQKAEKINAWVPADWWRYCGRRDQQSQGQPRQTPPVMDEAEENAVYLYAAMHQIKPRNAFL
ncbi:hypothetical protein AALO_G00126970 [Alosa alosa]|uniref:Uncharacterized protein n=1 Tax=Alosa alosa TaxID=278164 RepID=A0AAV6GLM8_9TELE|nr:hypothetical protein AALO_G00126970 [Alosa alosa]